ncbi:MAG: AAA domain-containing protein [Bacteroidota bacterium]|nr:AAA domain-containing protein [Bacteroidota bacterium]
MAFNNHLLEKLLKGVLDDNPVHLENDLMKESDIDNALSYLPISLSETQTNAISNSWKNEVSYIQGPPGTGKSHTIAAIMLSAIFLKKKVLLVSQKKAAIDVVKNKINSLLQKTSSDQPLICVATSSEERRKTKSYIETLLSETRKRSFDAELLHKKQVLEELKTSVSLQRTQISQDKARFSQAIDVERRFYEVNKEFVKKRDNFFSMFELPFRNNALALSTKNFDWIKIEADLHALRGLEAKRLQNGSLSRKDALKMKMSYSFFKRSLFVDKGKTIALGTSYLEKCVSLTKAFNDSLKEQNRISLDLRSLRRVIDNSEHRLTKTLEKYLSTKYEYDLSKKLREYFENDKIESVDQFQKMLYNSSPKIIAGRMRNVNYKDLTSAFPLWAGEIKDLGLYLSFDSEIFDMVIVDESSQVNIAEIMPAFYRGKRFCVVGDQKQLGLSAAGLFRLNKTFEKLTWNKHFQSPQVTTIEGASEKKLLVSESSILDFVTSPVNNAQINHIMLDEHFRSMPQLASFTSNKFYDGNLKIMTEVGDLIHKKCFKAIKVHGMREEDHKIVPEEVNELILQLRRIINEKSYLKAPELVPHGFTLNKKPTIGVLSFLTDQTRYIRERIAEEFEESDLNQYQVFIGTPEEFQGNERNVMFITLGLDGVSKWGRQHYQNPNRFNVATSRAINFTYIIYAGIPDGATFIRDYLRHFGIKVSDMDIVFEEKSEVDYTDSNSLWKYDETKRESEFEIRVSEYLFEYKNVNSANNSLRIYNQVPSCGKFLDFVIYNSKNKKCCAIEVDGKQHFDDSAKTYSESHVDRIAVLKRAGWNIIHVPYYKWYLNGWLSDDTNVDFRKVIDDFYSELNTYLL